MKEKQTVGLEEKLIEWVKTAKASGMTKDEAVAMLDLLWD
jgi:hypothetical protein